MEGGAMRIARPRYDKDSCYYHVFNRVAGEPGWYPFGEVEREAMFKLLRQLNKLYALDIVSFVAMGNHFHAVVRAPGDLPGVEEVDRRFKAYYGTSRMAPDWTVGDNYKHYARRMRDVSALMKDFQQQYTNWFNRTRPKGRRGRLWADRFKSVILESGRAVWECLQYVEMNPVRAGLVADPADYRHSTWGMLCGGGRHPFGVALAAHLPPDWRDLLEVGAAPDEPAGTLDDGQIVACLGIHLARLVAIEAGMDDGEVGEAVREAKRKVRFALRVSRRVRHWSDGAIIGSKLFVRNMTAEFYGAERAERKRFDESGTALVSFRQLRERQSTCPYVPKFRKFR
jgi:REP element-mobilizing transposase RayT